MRENKPKGIKVKFFKKSEYVNYLCPNCHEYLISDECVECGLTCEIEEIKDFDTKKEKNNKLNDIGKILENIFHLINRSH